MNGAEQAALAIRLEQALAGAGLRIVRGRMEGGNFRGWEPVAAEALIGRLLTFGWRIEDLPPYNGPRVLTLEPTE